MKSRVICFLIIFVAICVTSCTFSQSVHLKREVIKDEKSIAGEFTLVLYGGTHGDDIKTIAVLDSEGDDYEFEPFAPAFDFTITKHMQAEEALHEAISFVSWHHLYWRPQISRIMDRSDRTIGYEIRPLYEPLSFGVSDVLDVMYLLKDKKVMIYMWIKRHVEDDLERSGNDKGSKSH